jgi:photosystem II stability/assembly factor-like uncharacterized protein
MAMGAASNTWRAALVVAATAAAIGGAVAVMPPGAPRPQWLDLLELPSPATAHGERRLLLDVARAGARLVAVGESGLVMLSDDNGRQWRQALAPTAVMLTAVAFANDRLGWAVGHDGVILATGDGGEHWARQFDGRSANVQMLAAARARLDKLPAEAVGDEAARVREQAQDRLADAEAAVQAGPSRPLLGVRFTDATHGFAVGSFGQLFETSDSGAQWRYIGDRLPNAEGLHLNAISFTPQGELLIAAEAGAVFRSNDGGGTWTRANTGYTGHLFGVVPVTAGGEQVLLAHGFGGHVFRSTDSGTNWSEVASPTTKAIVQGASLGAGLVLLAAQDGQLIASRDGGRSFEAVAARPALRKVSAFTQAVPGGLVAVGLGGIAAIDASWTGGRP